MEPMLNLDAIERVNARDAASLAAGLVAAGMEPDEIALLRVAIEHDDATGQTLPGPEVQGWLAGLRVQAAHGLCSVTARVIAQAVEPMLMRYAAAGVAARPKA